MRYHVKLFFNIHSIEVYNLCYRLAFVFAQKRDHFSCFLVEWQIDTFFFFLHPEIVVSNVTDTDHFANLKVLCYTEGGEVLSVSFSIPDATGATTPEEYQALFTTYTFYWQGSGQNAENSSIRVNSSRMVDGNIFA